MSVDEIQLGLSLCAGIPFQTAGYIPVDTDYKNLYTVKDATTAKSFAKKAATDAKNSLGSQRRRRTYMVDLLRALGF